MSVSSLLLPVFVEVGLTFFLLFWMSVLRQRALTSGTVQPVDIALRQPAWPVRATQVSNCFNSQFELPVLFYTAVAFILITSTNSLVFVVLAWVFVLSRLVHAYIHTGANVVFSRSMAWVVGAIALTIMWIVLAVRVVASGA